MKGENAEKTTFRTLRSGRRVQVVAAPPKPSVPMEKVQLPYRRGEDNKIIFGDPNPDVYYRPVKPQYAQPSPPDLLHVSEIPWGKFSVLLQEYSQSKKGPDGQRFPGVHVRLRLKGGELLEGWIPAADLPEFRKRVNSERLGRF